MARGAVSICLVLALLLCVPQQAFAYSYSGYRWQGLSAQFDDSEYAMPAGFTACIRSAASTWNASGSDFDFVRNTSSTNYWGMSDLGEGSTIAACTISISGGYVVGVDTGFNENKTFSTSGGANAYDVESVALHEFGHWLFLMDVTSPSLAAMYYSLSLGQTKTTLHLDDVTGICCIYGPQP